LSLALLIGIGVIIPLATDYAEAGPHKHRKHRKHRRHYKKYSKGWWRQYRARMRHRRALQARRRALRLRQLRLATGRAAETSNPSNAQSAAAKPPNSPVAVLPSGDSAPSGWKPAQTSPAELNFRVDNPAG